LLDEEYHYRCIDQALLIAAATVVTFRN